jgi:predicted RNA methylase
MHYSTVVFSHASTKDYTGARKDDNTEPATVDRSRSTASVPLRAKLRQDSPIDYKYWSQRYQLFNKWACGVILDETAWYSVTPEGIAQHHATRCSSLPQHSDRQLTVLDLFCGAGGNAIQFALHSLQVVTFDIMRRSVDMAKENARIYGVADRIDFVVGDAVQCINSVSADIIYLSPPWGGPSYQNQVSHLHSLCVSNINGLQLLQKALQITHNVVYYLPRNLNLDDLMSLGIPFQVEKNFLNGKLKALTVYFGHLISQH